MVSVFVSPKRIQITSIIVYSNEAVHVPSIWIIYDALHVHARPTSGAPTIGSSESDAGISSRPESGRSVRQWGGYADGLADDAGGAEDGIASDVEEMGIGGASEGAVGAGDEEQEREAALHTLHLREKEAADEDADVAAQQTSTPLGGGTTALVCVVNHGRLHLASVGDSRAVLAQRERDGSTTAVRLTTDHTPTLPAERERILSQGGFISRGRIHGILAVSRALGDLELQPLVSPEPQVGVVQLSHPPSASNPVLILASDGVWGCMSDAEAADIAMGHTEPQGAAEAILHEVAARGGRDNASIIVAMWS